MRIIAELFGGEGTDLRSARLCQVCADITGMSGAGIMLEVADVLVEDFDVVDLLTSLSDRCVEVLDVEAAGVMPVSPGGVLRALAASSVAMRGLELFEEQSEEGPCPDCYRTGLPVVNEKLAAADDRWPRFAPRALAAGFHSAHALPMNLRDLTIGALNLFRADEGELDDGDVPVAQGLANVATIAILQAHGALEVSRLRENLAVSLNTRLAIEQARGVVAEQAGIDMGQALAFLRNHAARHHVRLAQLARDIVDGTLDATALDPLH